MRVVCGTNVVTKGWILGDKHVFLDPWMIIA
jgi:hypothetical protein